MWTNEYCRIGNADRAFQTMSMRTFSFLTSAIAEEGCVSEKLRCTRAFSTIHFRAFTGSPIFSSWSRLQMHQSCWLTNRIEKFLPPYFPSLLRLTQHFRRRMELSGDDLRKRFEAPVEEELQYNSWTLKTILIDLQLLLHIFSIHLILKQLHPKIRSGGCYGVLYVEAPQWTQTTNVTWNTRLHVCHDQLKAEILLWLSVFANCLN